MRSNLRCKRGHLKLYVSPRGKRQCRECNRLVQRRKRGHDTPELDPKPLTREEELEQLIATQKDDSSYYDRPWRYREIPMPGFELEYAVEGTRRGEWNVEEGEWANLS